MTSKYRRSFLPCVLLGLLLLLQSAPAVAQEGAPVVPDSAAHQTAAHQTAAHQTASAESDSAASGSLPSGHRSSGFQVSIDSESGDGVDSFLEFIAFSMFLLLLIAAAGAFAGGLAAVSIFMETGCLRALIATLGWGVAVVSGLIVGFLVGTAFGGIEAFAIIGLFGGGILYLAAWQQGRRYVQQLPKAERLTWKQTLMGGAILGTGAGSLANLARAAGALFKGGGGSFGGGGASGSFGGAQAVAAASAKGAAAKGAAAPGAVALGTVGVSGAASAPATAGQSEETSGNAPSAGSTSIKQRIAGAFDSFDTWLDAMVQPLRRFRWYHVAAFALIGLVFVPVGMGISAILRSGNFLLGLVLVGLSFWGFVQFVTTKRFGALRGLGSILLMGFIIASIRLAQLSTAPYWHLGGVLAVAGAVAFYRSRKRRTMPPASSTGRSSDAGSLFRGGSTSATWT